MGIWKLILSLVSSGTRQFSQTRVLMEMGAMGQEIQAALLCNKKSVMTGTFAILINLYKVLLRKHPMSSCTVKIWCNYTKILPMPWRLVAAAKPCRNRRTEFLNE